MTSERSCFTYNYHRFDSLSKSAVIDVLLHKETHAMQPYDATGIAS